MSTLHRSDVHHHILPVTQMSIDGLAHYDGFDPAARRAIERDNALALLPRLRQRAGGAGDA